MHRHLHACAQTSNHRKACTKPRGAADYFTCPLLLPSPVPPPPGCSPLCHPSYILELIPSPSLLRLLVQDLKQLDEGAHHVPRHIHTLARLGPLCVAKSAHRCVRHTGAGLHLRKECRSVAL